MKLSELERKELRIEFWWRQGRGFVLKQQTEGKTKKERKKGRKERREGEREKDKEGKGVPGDLIRLKFLGKQGKREFQKGQWGIKLAEKSRELRLKSSWGLSARGSLLILATAVPLKWWNQRPNCSSLRSARHKEIER